MEQGKPTNTRTLQAEHNISHVTFESAVAIEKALLEGRAEAAPPLNSYQVTAIDAVGPFPAHPYASLFPTFDKVAMEGLVEDIAENGLLNPIVLYEDKVLDGVNRQEACGKAGVAPRYVRYTGPSALGFVVAVNIRRRHLEEGQLAAIAANVATLARGGQSASLRFHGHSQEDAAKLVGVGVRVVTAAVTVRKTAHPVVFEAMLEGRVGAMRAAEIATLPREDQKMLVSKMPKDDIIKNHERIKKEIKRDETFKRINEQAKSAPAWPEGRYSVIYADPPTEDDFGHTKKDVEHHYPTMSWDDLKALPVEGIATEDAVLYLWSAPHVIHKMLEIMARWGFEYRTHMIWDKGRIGLGQWTRNQHEVLLIGRRGTFPPPPTDVRMGSVVYAPVTEEHSEKPEIFADFIETWYPTASKVELFRRGEARPGWAVYGFEALVDAL